MERDGDSISERRRPPHGRTTSVIPKWASLPPELVEGIADRVLSTTGSVDAYMDMRAVCPSWRSAVAKPSPLADLRFRPRHWIMVDLKSGNHDGDGDDARLFLHVPTGRFRRLRLPVLCDNLILGASDGLIVLREMEHPGLRGVRLLNPFTGDMLQFAAPFWNNALCEGRMLTAVSGGPQSALVVWRDWEGRNTVLHANSTSEEFMEDIGMHMIESMVSFQGNIYYAGYGCVLKFVAPDDELEVIADISVSPDMDIRASTYLVESAGELLLVRHCDQTLKVFRVDVEHKLLDEVKSIGGCRVLFLGGERCVSVGVDKLPSVGGDCVYMYNWVKAWRYRGRAMRMYNLRDGTVEIISNDSRLSANDDPHRSFHEDPWDYNSCGADNHHLGPLSLIQVLLDYCNDNTQF